MKNNFLSKFSVQKILSRSLFLVLFFTSISACIGVNEISTPMETTVPTSTQTLHPTAVFPTPTSTPVMTTWANEICWEKRSLDEAKADIAGSLLYLDFQTDEYKFLDVSAKKTKGTRLFVTNSYSEVHVSPDGKVFSFFDHESNKFLLFSDGGKKKISIPDSTYFEGYLDTSQIVLRLDLAVAKSYDEKIGATDQIYVLSPDTGELVNKSIFMPEFLAFRSDFRDNYWSYSPTLSHLLYVSGFDNLLLDINSGQLVKNKNGGQSFGHFMFFPDRPFWKFDGSAVTIINQKEFSDSPFNFYNIETGGDFVQLTHLEQLLPAGYYLKAGYWSPTGRYLAFVATLNADATLYILDLHTNTLITPCVSENRDESQRLFWPLYWSPTGDQLAMDIGGKAKWIQTDPNQDAYKFVREEWYDTVIVDLNRQLVYQIPDAMRSEKQELLGWLSWEIH